MKNRKRKPTVGLALSGGAARGYAHLGVIRVLAEHDISVDYVAGTSVGSVAGALLAGGYTPDHMIEVAAALKWQNLVSPTLSGMGLVTAKKLETFVGKLLGKTDFGELLIPFRAVATDIARTEEVVFSDGSVARAVRASCSVPGIFEPLVEGGTAYVDGGVTNNLPSSLVREMGADVVIAVDLNWQRPDPHLPVNLLDVTFRSFAMLLDRTSVEGRQDADVVIQPDLNEFSYHELSRADEMIERGHAAATAALPTINNLLSSGRKK
ncbi:MAG: patatin-like phospholipase family protein, partial [Alkalispirochaeta sp.]